MDVVHLFICYEKFYLFNKNSNKLSATTYHDLRKEDVTHALANWNWLSEKLKKNWSHDFMISGHLFLFLTNKMLSSSTKSSRSFPFIFYVIDNLLWLWNNKHTLVEERVDVRYIALLLCPKGSLSGHDKTTKESVVYFFLFHDLWNLFLFLTFKKGSAVYLKTLFYYCSCQALQINPFLIIRFR